jgi:hypothetical protein
MKLDLTGRVVGHQIFSPDPKDQPDLELVKISMTLSPATKDATKHTKAVLVVDKDEAFGELVLGAIVRITVEDKQQELFAAAGKPSGAKNQPAKDAKVN